MNAAFAFASHIVALKCVQFLWPDWTGNKDCMLKCETTNTSMFIRKKDCSLSSLAGSDEVSPEHMESSLLCHFMLLLSDPLVSETKENLA